MATDSARYLSALLAQMDGAFSLEEVKSLCFELGVDFDNLRGETKEGRIRDLIVQIIRRNRLPGLVAALRVQRPDDVWADAPPDLDLFGDDPFNTAPLSRLDFEPETVRVPAGPFLMGSDEDRPEEAPRHTVELDGFAIGIVPVTNGQYARFIQDTHRVVDSVLGWSGNSPRDDHLDHPVLGVTWYEAQAYCAWLAATTDRPYTLPTEAQWEKAARGPAGGLYPWGDEWDASRCNAGPDVTAVRAFPAQSAYGIYDLVGNGREWTLSVWGRDPRLPDRVFAYPWKDDRRNDPAEPATTRRVYRGGRYLAPRGYRCSARSSLSPDTSGPRANRLGFRVVLVAR